MDDQYCPAAGGGCEPQWIFGAWWLALVVGIAFFAAYDRYRDHRLERLAVGLGLAPRQRVVWGRGGPKWWGKWVVFGVLEMSLVTGIVVGALTGSFLIGFQAATIPVGRRLRDRHPFRFEVAPHVAPNCGRH